MIFIAVTGLVGAVIVIFFTYLRSTIPETKFEQISNWVKVFVGAAEQLFTGGGRGKEKLQYVADMLQKKGFTVDVDATDDAIRAMIESAVRELK